MSQSLLALSAAVLLASCASTSKQDVPAASVLPNGVVEYRCESGEQIAVRLDGVSVGLRLNGVAYTLPQLSTEAGTSIYSDGQHVLEIRQGRTYFGLGRSVPRLCTAR